MKQRTGYGVICAATVLVVAITMSPASGGGFGDFPGKVNDIMEKVDEYSPKVREYIDKYEDVTEDVGEKTRFFDDKMNPEYVKLWNREIERKRKNYKQAKRDYLDTDWYQFLTRKKRRQEMEAAEKEYVEAKARWEWEQYLFKRKQAEESTGWRFFRKGDRKRQAEAQLKTYVNTILNSYEKKIQAARDRYDETPGILFWKRWALEKEIEQLKKEYDRKSDELAQLYLKLPGDPTLYRGLENRMDLSRRSKEFSGALGALNGLAIGQSAPGLAPLGGTATKLGSRMGEETGSKFEQVMENVIVKIAELFGGDDQPSRRTTRIGRDSREDM